MAFILSTQKVHSLFFLALAVMSCGLAVFFILLSLSSVIINDFFFFLGHLSRATTYSL